MSMSREFSASVTKRTSVTKRMCWDIGSAVTRIQAKRTKGTDMENYGWVITKDHLHAEHPDIIADRANTTGPSNMDPTVEAALTETKRTEFAKRYTFRMYDDDDILYYTGRLVTFEVNPSEETLMGPLYDFGGPSAGATLIKYQGHPEWTIEY